MNYVYVYFRAIILRKVKEMVVYLDWVWIWIIEWRNIIIICVSVNE
jgi:hypothetical protein